MRTARQPHLPGFDGLSAKRFGGSLLGKGNPRDQRPISCKRPLHLVMRSTRATGARSLLSPRRSKQVEAIVRGTAKAQDVRVYRYANAGNHLHLLVLAPTRAAYAAFVRAISGLIARLVLGAEKGRPKIGVSAESGSDPATAAERARFWDARPFTRIVEWGRDYAKVCAYLMMNSLEALGFIPYRPRTGSNRRARGDSIPRSGASPRARFTSRSGALPRS